MIKKHKHANSVADALNSAKVTFKKIEAHFKYVMSFLAVDEASVYVTCHLISPKSPGQRIPSQFLNMLMID